jgi:hypothetical protein
MGYLPHKHQLQVSRGLYPQAKAEYSRVIELSQEALTLARKLKNPESEADSLTKLGAGL